MKSIIFLFFSCFFTTSIFGEVRFDALSRSDQEKICYGGDLIYCAILGGMALSQAKKFSRLACHGLEHNIMDDLGRRMGCSLLVLLGLKVKSTRGIGPSWKKIKRVSDKICLDIEEFSNQELSFINHKEFTQEERDYLIKRKEQIERNCKEEQYLNSINRVRRFLRLRPLSH